jgi:hypothetical protein
MGIKLKLKEYFRSVLAPISGIPESQFVFDLREEIGGMVPPYAMILAPDAEITDKWERDMHAPPSAAGQGPQELYEKCRIRLPLSIIFAAETEDAAGDWEDAFRKAIPRTLWLGGCPDGTRVWIEQGAARYSEIDSTVREVYGVQITVTCVWKVYLTRAELEALEPKITE